MSVNHIDASLLPASDVSINQDACMAVRPEVLPLRALVDGATQSSQLAQPPDQQRMPGIATKNNLLKLNWWHSPIEPFHNSNEAALAHVQHHSSELNHINNNNTTLQSSFNTPTTAKITPANYQSHLDDQNDKLMVVAADGIKSTDEGSIVFEPDDDFGLQDSQLLVNDPQPCMAILNVGQEDEMKIYGYRRSRMRTILCWLCIFLTAGLLRLVLHWWRHWYLYATCLPCSLQDAEQVLVEEDYQGKHKLFHVKPVRTLGAHDFQVVMQQQDNTLNETLKLQDTLNENKFHLSVHFSSAQFKSFRTLRIFRCKQLVYAWDNSMGAFNKINGMDCNVPCSYFHHQRGLTPQEQLSRRIVYGANEITIPYRDAKTLLLLEMLNPFYVFQIFSVVLWFTYDYYYYACVILLMSIFGITVSIVQTKKNQDVLRQTVLNTGNAWVLNAKGNSKEVPTQSLVVGDIIEIPSSGCTMQCDAVLLSGNCILDESMLTGESVPVTKTPLPLKRDIIFDKKEHARHTLFCGTKIIQTRYIGSKRVLAFVINTGNITAKGGLIRSILYPPPVDYKFEKDSYKFIQCLALIACIGFVYTLVTKILRGTDAVKIAVESLDLITIVVPPALPAAMTVGRVYAQKRLKRENIYCISPRSINVSGGIDCCCFDKTGTLTEDGLDMWGVLPKSLTNQFQIHLRDVQRLPYDHFLFSMVTCHSITIMNGKMMGDPLDLKMFESTGWALEDSKNVPENEKYNLIYPTILRQPRCDKKNYVGMQGGENETVELNNIMVERQSSVDDLLANVGLSKSEKNYDHGIVREFPFTSNLQRMSVITRCLSLQSFNVYCKGSPEMLQQLCLPQSLPENYSEQLSVFAKKGYRIIAMAYKALSPKINYTKAQRLGREEVEHNLQFLGFVILENRLKADTTNVINSLNMANIRTIMVTGDNILTAMSVARDCGIVKPSQAVITVHAKTNTKPDTGHYELQYTLDLGSKARSSNLTALNPNDSIVKDNMANGNAIENSSYACNSMLNSDSLNSVTSVRTCDTWTTHNHIDIEMGTSSLQSIVVSPDTEYQSDRDEHCWRHHYGFAMDGKTWQVVREHFPEQMQILLTRGVVYARMSPEQKQALIMELQSLDFCVAMCGDGANDCGALKVAHTGISLSETESSIASPFTSRNPTIAAVPNVIKEGRAALVTSFGIFKYMAAYSFVQFVSVMILYSIDSNLTDKQFLYIDLGLISIFAFFFGKTEAYNGQLVKQVPLSSLISPTPLASIVIHLCVVIAFQVVGWFHLRRQPWFEPFQHSNEDHLGCYENYTIFAISSFQYIILAFVFSKGAPFRRPIWSNFPFCLSLVINLSIVIYLIVYPSTWLANFFQLIIPPELTYRLVLLVYGALNFIAHVFVEYFIVEYLIFKNIQLKREENFSTSKRKYMRLEHKIRTDLKNWPPITEIYEPLPDPTIIQETLKPSYVNLGAEQNLDIPSAFPGFEYNDIGMTRVTSS